MKKIYFVCIFVSIFFVACTPQVTVTLPSLPTETPVPTPTLNPKITAIQEKIAASGVRFSLDVAEGLIYDGDTPIPGMTVSPDGTMTLSVDGETITLDPTDVSFDDENGITIDGYVQDPETGVWVEAAAVLLEGLTLNKDGTYTLQTANGGDVVLQPSQVAIDNGSVMVKDEGYYLNPEGKMMMTAEKLWANELKEWGLNTEDYAEHHDVDGNLAMVKKSTGEIVYWVDENGVGYWNLQVMRKMIVEIDSSDSRSCKPTRWTGTKWTAQRPTDDESFTNNFSRPFVEKIKKILTGMEVPYKNGIVVDFLGGSNNCWAMEPITTKHQNADQVENTVIFWMNEDGIVFNELVFSPKVKKIALAKV